MAKGTLVNEIQNILTPQQSIGFVQKKRIYQLQPLLPVKMYLQMTQDLPDTDQQSEVIQLLTRDEIVIYNGIVYLKTKGLNLKGRLKEIVSLYYSHLRTIIGDKKALIDLYEQIPAEDIANLTEDHVVFVLLPLLRGQGKGLAAIRYLPPYTIHYEAQKYYMPGCTVAVHVDPNLTIGNPEIIALHDRKFYEHPFVYRDSQYFGQRVCLGSFYRSTDERQIRTLRFANNINSLIKQTVQILVSGYSRGVEPANGHLTSSQYHQYLDSTYRSQE